MQKYKKHRRMLYILVGILFLLTLLFSTVKILYFGFSLSGKGSFFYQIDCSISFDPEPGREAVISLAVPEPVPGYLFELDTQSTRFRHMDNDGGERLVCQLPPPLSGRQHVDCRYRLVPDPHQLAPFSPPEEKEMPAPVIADDLRNSYQLIWDKVDPEKKLTNAELIPALLHHLGTLPPSERKVHSHRSGGDGTVEMAIGLLSMRNIPARRVRCVNLEEKKLQQQPELLLDISFGGAWHIFRPNSGLEVSPEKLLILQRSENSMLDVVGARNSATLFSVTQVPAGAEQLNELRAQILNRLRVSNLTLFSLPAQEQNRFKWLGLLPLAILLIVLARNVVGIQTMGTFMPVLIAMAFLEMKLLPGLINFLLILTVGLMIRSWLSRLNLLMVPRISAVVVVVILLMQLISIAANFLRLSDFMGITFFPLIIIAWTIERASTTWEEDGARNTLKQLGASLGAAAVCYLILSNSYLQYLLYAFSELNLMILGFILLLGTYTGYRLTELFRFEPLVQK